jgi:gliding motility-associated-like protein
MGDGNSSFEPQPTHTFQKSGSFNVSLFVTDENKCESNFTAPGLVKSIAKPTVNFSVDKSIACIDTQTVFYNNASLGATTLNYYWDFGNGETSTEISPSQFYSGFNNYTVSLNAVDTFGCSNTLVKSDFIQLQELKINVEVSDDYLCKKENLQITNQTIGANKNFWIFGDGSTSVLETPIKSYQDTGLFTVTYIASFDDYCTDTIRTKIEVDAVTAKFESDKEYGCEFPFSVHYQNSSINAAKWEWIFSDFSSSSDENPIVEYGITTALKQQRNMYLSDTLIVESELHCKDTMVIDSNIHLYLPQVYFTPNDSSIYKLQFTGCVPLALNFVNKSKSYFDNDPFVSLEWDFGDSGSSTENNPVHNYADVGDFPVTLSVTNQSGCVNTYTSTLLAGSPQNALFNYPGNPVICGSEIIHFNNQSTTDSLIDAWKWLFSDDTKAEIKNPEIQFKDSGFISGELKVFYNGCEGSTYMLDSFVYVKGPAGDVLISLNCDEPLKYNFYSDIKGADSCSYNFGDGNFDLTLSENVLHEYQNNGDYKLIVDAKNADESCELHIEKNIYVRQLKAEFIYSPTNICPYSEVTFNPESTRDNTYFVYENKLVKYLWNFGDSTDLELKFGPSNHVFTEPGNYNVLLRVQDVNGCAQELQKEIKVYKVEAAFNYSDSIGCAPLEVSFFDNSNADTTLVNWLWNFGDSISTDQNPVLTYTDDTSHMISLIVADIFGCSDTIIKPKAIYSSNPFADFSTLKTNTCFNDSIRFLNMTEGSLVNKFEWNFGDGATSADFDPNIVFTDTGFFDVSLKVIDSLGCIAEVSKPNFIYVQANPIADFTLNAFSSACYPKVIGFTDASISNDLKNRIWDFGDSELGTNVINPYHTYRKPGNYSVKLKVSTSIGCVDTLTKQDIIEIGGPYAEIIAPDTACVNTPISISFAEGINIDNFQWTLNDGSSYLVNAFEKEYADFGVKIVYLNLDSDTLGTCHKLIVDSIEMPLLSAEFTLNDTALCTPFITSAINSSINGNEFEWFVNNAFASNKAAPEIQIVDAGIQSVKLIAISSAQCRDSITKQVIVYPLPDIGLNNDTIICQFDSILLKANNGIQYFWYAQNEIIDSLFSNILVTPDKNTRYSVKVINENSCVNFDSTQVDIKLKPNVNIITHDSTLIIGETLELTAQHNFTDDITWQPSDYLSCLNCESTTAQPLEDITYYFIGTDNLGCFSIVDSVNIKVDEKYSVDVASSFTPNGDGINDKIFVMGWGIQELDYFKIYDINGRIVFQTSDISEGWDGNSKLGLQTEGMYLYEVSVVSLNNKTRRKQGYIYLIR